MKNKRTALYTLAIMLVGVIYSPLKAQQKKVNNRTSFAGEWAAKESISMGGNIYCSFAEGDRMVSKTMKITTQPNYLTIAASNSFTGGTPVKSIEKLTFNGKPIEINYEAIHGKKYTVKLSADGQTMTVNSTVYLNYPHQKSQVVYVTEVWKLGNDGKSIIVQANAKSTMFDEGRNWETVFYKVDKYSKVLKEQCLVRTNAFAFPLALPSF